LWAEYDQPAMLVIHEFIVDESTPLPVDVAVRFPKDGNLTAVAYQDNGTLINMDFSGPTQQGDWQIVTLKVTSYAPYRIEYYEPLTRNGNQRSFVFSWFGDYPVNDFTITTQLPVDSTNVVSEPPFASTVKSDDGTALVGFVTSNGLGLGQSSEFKIQYERDSETVVKPANSSDIQPSEPIGTNTEGRISINNLPWIIGGFGLALIGLALFFYWRSTQTSEQKSRRRRRSRQNAEQSESGEAYCHECGARAHPGDRFCRTCGSKLRV
jgi:ribosomal protein L40E